MRELAAHKEHVAAEYVSRDALDGVTEAINRLADRLTTSSCTSCSRRMIEGALEILMPLAIASPVRHGARVATQQAP